MSGNTVRSTKGRQTYYDNHAEFVDLALTKKQETELKSSGFARKQWTEAYNAITVAGYKVTVKTDSRNNSVMCMVQTADYDPDAQTTIYVMRSGTAQGALLKLAYYWAISDGTLPDSDARKADAESDDDLFM